MSTKATPNPADNHELVERIMYVEKIFDVHIPDDEPQIFSVRKERCAGSRNTYPDRPIDVHSADWQNLKNELGWLMAEDVFAKQTLMKSLPHLAEYIWLDRPSEHPRKSRWEEFRPTKASVLLFAAIAFFILLWR